MAKKKEEKELISSSEQVDIKKIKKDIDNYLEEKQDEVTDEILEKVEGQIDFLVSKRMREEEKRLVRGKNGKIIRRDFVIIILLMLTLCFGYCLWDCDYFNLAEKLSSRVEKNNNDDEIKDNIDKDNNKEEDKKEEEKHDSSYYINKYQKLVDNMQIEDEAIFTLYTDNTTSSNISNELKLKIAYKNLSANKKTINDGVVSFNSADLLETAKEIFGDEVLLNYTLFNYNGSKFVYHNDAYIGFGGSKADTGFIYKIVDGNEEEDIVTMDVIVAKTEGGKLLSINNEVILQQYSKDINLVNYKDKLDKYRFSFNKNDDYYVFKSIMKVK